MAAVSWLTVGSGGTDAGCGKTLSDMGPQGCFVGSFTSFHDIFTEWVLEISGSKRLRGHLQASTSLCEAPKPVAGLEASRPQPFQARMVSLASEGYAFSGFHGSEAT